MPGHRAFCLEAHKTEKNISSSYRESNEERRVNMYCRLMEKMNPTMEKIMNIEMENSWSNKTVEIENEEYQT